MEPALARLSLYDRTPLAPFELSFWQGTDVRIDFAIFKDKALTTLVTDFSNLTNVQLEIHLGKLGGGGLIIAGTPILVAGLNNALTLSQWTAGTHQHGTFTLTAAQMNQTVNYGILDCWCTIFSATTNGGKIVHGAGPFRIHRSRASGTGTPPAPPTLYYTKNEVDALIASGVGGSTNLTFSRSGTSVTVLSDTGTDAILPAADATNAGVMTSADKVKLDGISGTGTTNLTFSRNSTTVTVLSDTGSDAALPSADATNAGVMLSADKVKLDALPTNAALTQSLAGKASLAHQHTFSEVLDLPAITPRDVASLVLPVGSAGSALTHSIPVSTAYYLFQVRPSAQNYVLGLLLEGVTPNSAQLAAIDQFFAYSDSTGFVAGQPSGARLLLPVWNNNNANVLNLLNPATVSTKARLINAPAGFVTTVGSIKTDMTATNKGFIAMDTTSAAAWATDDWSYGYYSHLAAVLADNAMIGGRNDTISGSTNRYICTTTGTVARWTPGYTVAQSPIDAPMTTSNPLGLIWIGYKGTKLDARQVKAAGSTTLFDTTGTFTALLTAVPFLGLAYNQEAGVSSLSGQPASLLFVGKKIANDATASTTLATALYNLAIGTGATAV